MLLVVLALVVRPVYVRELAGRKDCLKSVVDLKPGLAHCPETWLLMACLSWIQLGWFGVNRVHLLLT